MTDPRSSPPSPETPPDMYIDTPNVKISRRFAEKTGMIEPSIECCVLCGEPKNNPNLKAGDEVANGWPSCVNPSCVAFGQPTASAWYRPVPNSGAAFQDDVAAILRALGLGDHARPISPHEVVRTEILPAIARLQHIGRTNRVMYEQAKAELGRLAASPRSSLTAPTELTEALDELIQSWVMPGDVLGIGTKQSRTLRKEERDAARSKVEDLSKALRDENERHLAGWRIIRELDEQHVKIDAEDAAMLISIIESTPMKYPPEITQLYKRLRRLSGPPQSEAPAV